MYIQEYIKLAIIFLVIISIIYLPILFILKKRGIGIIRQISYLSLFFSALIIVFATIIIFTKITFSPDEYHLSLIPFERFKGNVNILKTIITEMIPNIIIFIPLGIFIPIVFKKARKLYKTALIIFLVTFSIESFQYFIGRLSDIDDIITNLLGGVIGFGIFRVSNYLFKDKNLWNKFIGKD
jgi:glycopeptide antibiotics resistance protein